MSNDDEIAVGDDELAAECNACGGTFAWKIGTDPVCPRCDARQEEK